MKSMVVGGGPAEFQAVLASMIENGVFDKWRVVCETHNRLLGGWPKGVDATLAMLAARVKSGVVDPAVLKAFKERLAGEEKTLEKASEEAVEAGATGFQSDEHGIYLRAIQLKAGLREVGITLGFCSSYGWRDKLNHGLTIRGDSSRGGVFDRIYLYRREPDGEERLTNLKEPDGEERLVAHVVTRQGPRSTIKFHEAVEPGTLFSFEVWRAAGPCAKDLPFKDLCMMLELLQENGLGCSRSQQFGKIKILTIEQIAEGALPFSGAGGKPPKAKKAADK